MLLVFDFSGTLSIGAARFGRAENLTKALQQAGVWQLGLNSPEMFWNEVIARTWEWGATTAVGYVRVLTDRLKQLCHAPEEQMYHAVSSFADQYFAASVIHPAWHDLLRTLSKQPENLAVIATDHYAEATGHIVKQLAALGITGIPLAQAHRDSGGSGIIVANSADVGHLKTTRQFWESLKQARQRAVMTKIQVIDDFGYNEASQDHYAAAEKVAARQQITVALLAEVFGCRIETFPFVLNHAQSDNQAIVDNELQEVVRRVIGFLN